ncbi:MAG: hypothetical protein GY745_08630 [Actinomycetia bacterium]|nr:hypothetical protein [Actinomycetes bacterium]
MSDPPTCGRGRVAGLIEVVGESGPEEPEGPLLGEGPGFAEEDRYRGVADLEPRDQIGEPTTLDLFVLEDLGVTLFDHHYRQRVRGKTGHLVSEAAVGESFGWVGGTPVFDQGHDLVFVHDAVIADRQFRVFGGSLLLGELVRVALSDADRDREVRQVGPSSAWYPYRGSGPLRGLGAWPEDALMATDSPSSG